MVPVGLTAKGEEKRRRAFIANSEKERQKISVPFPDGEKGNLCLSVSPRLSDDFQLSNLIVFLLPEV